jgi:hypothetical protein
LDAQQPGKILEDSRPEVIFYSFENEAQKMMGKEFCLQDACCSSSAFLPLPLNQLGEVEKMLAASHQSTVSGRAAAL